MELLDAVLKKRRPTDGLPRSRSSSCERFGHSDGIPCGMQPGSHREEFFYRIAPSGVWS